MSWTATFTARGCEIRFTGQCDGPEVHAAHREIFAHKYEEGFQYAIVDFSQLERLDLLLADLLRIAEHDRQYLLRNPSYLVATIAPQAHVFGLLRTFERYMEGSGFKSTIVTTREQAIAWLNNELATA
jgi:hypothetical protein